MALEEVWLAYVDDEDGGNRENWSVFYCTPIVASTEQAAKDAAKLETTKQATETAMDCDGDLTNLSDFENELHTHIVGPISIVLP